VTSANQDAEESTNGAVARLRQGALAWREIDGEIVALEVESSTYIAANRTGGVLWQRLTEGATEQDLVAELMSRFDIEAARAQTDVADFLAALDERGLLEPSWVTPAA
jgi:hypothetical protein